MKRKLISAFLLVTLLPLPLFALDVDAIPFLNEDSRANLNEDFERSDSKCRKSYTVAVSKSGFWSVYCHSNASTSDLVRIATQKCEHISQSLCGIVYLGGTEIQHSESAPLIRYPKQFDAKQIPFVRSDSQKRLEEDYGNEAGGFKALAMTRNGTYGFEVDRQSEADAVKHALAKCNELDKERGRCFIYAVGNDVQFDNLTNIYPDQVQ